MPRIEAMDTSEDEIEKSSTIVVDHIHKAYGDFDAVNGVSFTVNKGEIFGIIGPNGAGKTTTVECISGLREADSGSISVFGYSPKKNRKKIREFVGVQLQESSLPPRLRVREALKLFASFYSNPVNPDELLETLGIADIKNKPFRSLSGGQKQRLSIALSLVGNPKVAILDELTTGLDPEARRETWSLIEAIRDRGVTVILVTHFMDEAERLCDRIALINHGTVVALDTPESIAKEAGGTRVSFRPSARLDDETLDSIPGVRIIDRKGKYVTVIGTGNLSASVTDHLGKIGIQIDQLEVKSGNLDDAFIMLTKGVTDKVQGGNKG